MNTPLVDSFPDLYPFLSAEIYTKSSWFDQELEHIFRRTWLYVGHTDSLFAAAATVILDIADRSIILTRNPQGQLKAFHNVCAHRASPLELSRRHQLTCPYHGWIYNSDGTLIGVPGKNYLPAGFKCETIALSAIRVEQWGDLIFLCFDPTAPSLLEFLGKAYTVLNGYALQNMRLLFARDTAVQCNWKTFHDNGLCDYHVDIAHRETLKDTQGPRSQYRFQFDQYVNALITPIPEQWKADNQILEELPPHLRSHFYTFGIFPNLHLYTLPDGTLYIERINPVSVDTCQVRTEVYGVRGHCPDAIAELETWYDRLFQEDAALTEGVQKGYESGIYTPGPVSRLESRILHHQQLIRQFLSLAE